MCVLSDWGTPSITPGCSKPHPTLNTSNNGFFPNTKSEAALCQFRAISLCRTTTSPCKKLISSSLVGPFGYPKLLWSLPGAFSLLLPILEGGRCSWEQTEASPHCQKIKLQFKTSFGLIWFLNACARPQWGCACSHYCIYPLIFFFPSLTTNNPVLREMMTQRNCWGYKITCLKQTLESAYSAVILINWK